MSGYTVRAIADMQTIAHGVVRLAGAELQVESFGMQVLELPTGFEHYPEHDHRDEGMEEVYVVLHGTAEVEVDGERVALDSGRMLRVDAASRRKVLPGPDGARVLALGGLPGRPYQRPESFTLEAQEAAR